MREISGATIAFIFFISMNVFSVQSSNAEMGGRNSTNAPCVSSGNSNSTLNSTKGNNKMNYCRQAPTISEVTIQGNPSVGQTLTATYSSLTGSPTPILTYTWFTCAEIPNSNSSTYLVTQYDVDFCGGVAVLITAENGVWPSAVVWSPIVDFID